MSQPETKEVDVTIAYGFFLDLDKTCTQIDKYCKEKRIVDALYVRETPELTKSRKEEDVTYDPEDRVELEEYREKKRRRSDSEGWYHECDYEQEHLDDKKNDEKGYKDGLYDVQWRRQPHSWRLESESLAFCIKYMVNTICGHPVGLDATVIDKNVFIFITDSGTCVSRKVPFHTDIEKVYMKIEESQTDLLDKFIYELGYPEDVDPKWHVIVM